MGGIVYYTLAWVEKRMTPWMGGIVYYAPLGREQTKDPQKNTPNIPKNIF